jgi:alpha-galactosidase
MVQDGMRRPARIYEDSGTHTCSSHGFPGSLGQEYQDALTFAQWGVDYLKYDDCDIPASGQNAQSTIQRYDTMRDALLAARAKTGHDIVFSICEKTDYGVPNSTWPPVGNLWRTTGDIHDTYASMLSNFENNVQLFSLARPGAWNDPDMLEIGNGGMSVTEEQAEFSGAWGAPWVRGGGQPPMAMAKTWRRRAGWAEPSVMVPVPLAGP